MARSNSTVRETFYSGGTAGSCHEQSLKVPEVERVSGGSEECPVVIEDDPADGASGANVVYARSDGGKTGHCTDVTNCIANSQEHNLDGY
jgi:hypothetical protein